MTVRASTATPARSAATPEVGVKTGRRQVWNLGGADGLLVLTPLDHRPVCEATSVHVSAMGGLQLDAPHETRVLFGRKDCLFQSVS